MFNKNNKKRKFKSIIIAFLREFYVYRLTYTGRYLFIMGLVFGLLSSVVFYGTFLLYSLVLFLMVVFIMSPFLERILRPRLDITITTPTRTSSGSSVAEEIIIKNISNKNAYFTFFREVKLHPMIVQEQDQGIMLPILKKGGKIKFRLNLIAQKRGDYRLKSLRVDSPFPLGVMKWGYRYKKERRILVYPQFKPLIGFNIPVSRKLQPGGIALASNIGESTEFVGTREFRDGDSLRHIHWKSWARLNKPIVKVFQEEYYCRLALLIDTYIPDNSPDIDYEAMESSLSLAASISDYLERQEYIIDLIAAGPNIYYLQAGRALAYLDQILDILACLDVCRKKPYGEIEPLLMDDLSRISAVVVLLLGWDEERKEFLLRLKEMGVEMKVFLVSNRKEDIDIGYIEGVFGSVQVLDSESIKRGFDYL